jgi:hypothetical protein
MIRRLLTKNFTAVPLLWIDFNYQIYKKNGEKGSCMLHVHPELRDDEFVKEKLEEIVDHVRQKYNMRGLI